MLAVPGTIWLVSPAGQPPALQSPREPFRGTNCDLTRVQNSLNKANVLVMIARLHQLACFWSLRGTLNGADVHRADGGGHVGSWCESEVTVS